MALFLRSWRFSNQDEVEASAKELAWKDKKWYQREIKE